MATSLMAIHSNTLPVSAVPALLKTQRFPHAHPAVGRQCKPSPQINCPPGVNQGFKFHWQGLSTPAHDTNQGPFAGTAARERFLPWASAPLLKSAVVAPLQLTTSAGAMAGPTKLLLPLYLTLMVNCTIFPWHANKRSSVPQAEVHT